MLGVFITFEGPEGAGKTTLIRHLIPRLQEELSVSILSTREPGGNIIAEKIREIILNPEHTAMDARTEALLYAAARRQHLVDNIQPALNQGSLVICDRFVDSSIAYQGFARKIGEQGIYDINAFAIEDCQPNLTFYIDIPVEVGLQRIQAGRPNEINRLDMEDMSFHERVREGYLKLVNESNTNRFVSLDGRQDTTELVDLCITVLKNRFPKLFKI